MLISLGLTVGVAMPRPVTAQPADCPDVPAGRTPSLPVTIELAGHPGVPSGVNGRVHANLPMQAPRTDCGEASPPADILQGEPGDLLRGTPAPAAGR